jgi:hypothetical protein
MNNMLSGNNNNNNFCFNNMYAPHYEVIQVNGEAGAKNIRMSPNSSCLLLDNSAPIIWLATTDGAGYLTVTPYDYMPHQVQQPVDINLLAQRVSQLEETINARQSNVRPNKQSKKQQSTAIESTSNTEC